MPYLNWKTKNLNLIRSVHPALQTQLEVQLAPADLAELRGRLQECLLGASATSEELRLDLQLVQGGRAEIWSLYFKRKQTGLSKLTVAHSQDKEWVASLILSATHAEKFCLALENLEQLIDDAPIHLSRLENIAALGNFELILSKSASDS